ncbi:MAG TPA: hypothetical protein VEK11_24760 [Thermoanaerobaculia bacterium]|nr:hypothetical protein [Thermoanaerobaculia bacterium]
MKTIFQRDHARYEGVRPVQIYFLRTLFLLMFLFVGYDSWRLILTHDGPWDPVRAAAWCMFAAYSLLAILGVFRPLKMLPIVLFMGVYKTAWLSVVAYPLWSRNQLAGSPAEEMAKVFIWVLVAMVGVPWGYVVEQYLWKRTPAPRAGGALANAA